MTYLSEILKTVAITAVMALSVSASAQTITLMPNAGLDVNVGPCTEITAGTTLTFNRTAACDEDILITTTAIPPVELLQSSDAVVTYTFNTEGSFVVFCGAPTSGMDVAVQAICVNVGPAAPVNPIPTIGEWGIIMALIMLLIIGVVVLRQPEQKRIQA